MTYEEELNELLKFCEVPRRASEIQEKFGLKREALQFRLRKLRANGNMVMISLDGRPNGHGTRYVATGRSYSEKKKRAPQYVSGVTVMGVKL